MPAYRASGGMDDPILVDGDAGFVGMDQRRQGGQLEAGLVRVSRNGRMDGYWQPRKGAELISGALALDTMPLRVPFFCIDTTGGFTGSGLAAYNVTGALGDAYGDPVVFPTLVYAGTFGGYIYYSSNWAGSIVPPDSGEHYILYRLPIEYGGIWTLQKYVDGDLVADWEDDGSAPATPDLATGWSGLPVFDGNFNPIGTTTGTPSIASTTIELTASRDGELVTIHSEFFPLDGDSGWVEIKDFETAGKTVNINGIRFVTYNSAVPELTFSISGSPVGLESYVGPGTLISSLIDDTVSTILGSCSYSDPSSNNDEYIILATNSVAKKVSLQAPYPITDLPYPGTSTLSEPVELLQAFDRVMMFRDGERPWCWVPRGRTIQSSSYVSSTGRVTVRCKDHGLQVGDVVTIADVGYSATPPVANPNGSQTVSTVTDADTFTFLIASGSGDETYTPNTGRVVADFFTLAPAGAYTQPQTFDITAKDVDVVDGLVTIDLLAAGDTNTTIRKGDFVQVYKAATSELSVMEGKSYEVVTATPDAITFYAPVGNYNTSSTDAFVIGGRFSIGGGFMHPPAPPWGVYFQRRLWVPYWYEPNGTYSSPTYRDRNVRDQIAASDILDPATFDQIESQFRITAGIADFTVGMQPFYEDALMVLNRNSLHIVVGTQGTLADTVVKELTREVGCLARKSVISQGNTVFFLSDNGVYGVSFLDGYNLRGIEEPLSKPIQPIIDRINKRLADKAVAAYFNNRYYLALPLDSTKGADDASGNNAVVIFNTLNGGWESLDTFGVGNFNILNFHIARANERNDLYAVNEFGGVHKMESRDVPVDRISFDVLGGASDYSVDYELQTRSYTFGTQERKRFSVAQVQMQSDDSASDVIFSFASDDPDSGSESIGSIVDLLGNELEPMDSANIRARVGGVRGYQGALTISANLSGSAPIGRPKIQSVVMEATVTNRATISQH